MSWLWIDCPQFCVRVELDENDKVKSLPPILIKRFPYFGRNKEDFIERLKYVYRWMPYLTVKEME